MIHESTSLSPRISGNGITLNSLKYIAILAMTIDHIAFAFVPDGTPLAIVMHIVGRITGPVMFFSAVEGYTTAFVLGNHENYDAYKDYPREEWHGGQIQRIRPSVLHLMRGQVYELNGRKFFTMGGASSHDIQDGILEPDDPDFEEKFQQLEQRGALFRVNHRSWWAEELPSEAEYLEARANLARVHWNVDYIISHCCPSSIQDVFSGGMFKKDALTEFFDEVRQKCTFQYWFFGHYHSNMVIEKRYAMLYEQIIRLK